MRGAADDSACPSTRPDATRDRHAGEPWERAAGAATPPARASALAELVLASGLHRVDVIAWRDLDDPEAGGSEIHAHEVLRRWAAAGLDVNLRTSAVVGGRAVVVRDGYTAVRRSDRYAVFPRVAGELGWRRPDQATGLIEIWNGMPFLSPLWARRTPRMVFVHHVHAEMWDMVLSPGLARLGRNFETRLAPYAYRRTRIVTLSESSRDEIVSMLGLRSGNVSVVPPGIETRFSPAGTRSERPLVVAVGRLVPVKRFELLIDAAAQLRARHPGLRVVIAGEGYERRRIEEHIRRRGAGDIVSLAGRLSDAQLVDLYRQAWLVASTSAREGWGMTIIEAAACGTPSVVTRIAGHVDAVLDGRTGLLADPGEDFVAKLDGLLSDEVLRRRLGRAALKRAATFDWDTTAYALFSMLAVEAEEIGLPRANRRR